MAVKKRYDYLRDEFHKLGWITTKIETWGPNGKNDAWGMADMLVAGPKRLFMVQQTTRQDFTAHTKKIKPLRILKENVAPVEGLYQIAVSKVKIGNRERWAYMIGIYSINDNGDVELKMLNSFKDKDVNLDKLVEYETSGTFNG